MPDEDPEAQRDVTHPGPPARKSNVSWHGLPPRGTPLAQQPPCPTALTCISSVMATKSATEMWGPGQEVLVLQELVLKQLQAPVQLGQSVCQCLRGTRWPRNTGNIIWQAERGLSVCLGPGLVPALILLASHPGHFLLTSSPLPAHGHHQPGPHR